MTLMMMVVFAFVIFIFAAVDTCYISNSIFIITIILTILLFIVLFINTIIKVVVDIIVIIICMIIVHHHIQ